MENNNPAQTAPQIQKAPVKQQTLPEQQTTPDISEKKQSKLSKILIYGIASLTLLALGAFGFWVYQEKVVKKPTPSPIPMLTPTIAPVPTSISAPESIVPADWKTYRNEEYKYSIKYPPQAKIEEGPGYEERIQETIITFFGPGYQGPGEFTDGYGITLAVIKNPNNNTPIQLAQESYSQTEEVIKNKILEGDISRCKVEDVVRNNTKGAKFTHCTQAPGTGILNFSEWYVKNGITYKIYAVLQNEDYLETFNQILSTFKFID